MTATNKSRTNDTNNSEALGNRLVPGVSRVSGQVPTIVRNANVSARDIVMMEFMHSSLQMSRRFLESQERVMLAYLRGNSSNPDPIYSDRDSFAVAIDDTNDAARRYEAVPYVAGNRDHNHDRDYGRRGNNGHETNGHETNGHETNGHETNADESIRNQAAAPKDLSSPSALARTYRNGDGSSVEGNGSSGYMDHSRERSSNNGAEEASQQPGRAMASTPPAAVAGADSPAGELSPEQLVSELINIVSERTGYPPEMLDPTLDLEADLGIDSIKRVEILNSFRKLLPDSKQSALEDGIEKLAGLKTLQGITEWIRNDLVELCEGSSGASSAQESALESPGTALSNPAGASL